MRAPRQTVNAVETATNMKLLSDLMRHAKRRAGERERALSLYIAAVEQARRPGFYTDCGVADSVDGRFDLIVLHVFLVIRALRRSAEPGKRLSDLIFKIMMDDMDMNLREMGVGDLRVGKRVKSMARAFYGRAAAYDSAFDADRDGAAAAGDGAGDGGEEGLEAALLRNIYGAEEPQPGEIERLLRYVRGAEEALAGQPHEDLLGGETAFPAAPGESAGSEAAAREPNPEA
ncbi:MAG: ubiquinol-cytochrome C chaperone family protein [Alphaproteobacteria bacterium]|nr:ubiquinol-cytochrome C chaperone family protein [Alphaproteobacteria bacterium]|tara:strand:- start:421 stop:1113 length:693 start_codon:yes stop_codon:yes gene_type:complete